MSESNNTTAFVTTDYLTIGQLASNLGWSVRFIEGLIRGEDLPGMEINGAWHFRREDVIDWLEQKIQTLDSGRVRALEKRVESSLVADGTFRRAVATDRLVSRMPDEGIAVGADIHKKMEILRALVCLAERTGLLYEKDQLLASLIDRESLCSTAMPGGIAICHPRRPIPSAIATQFICFLKTREPVDFGDGGEEGTSMFFLICAADDRSHLYGLARLARILHNGAIDLLREAKTEKDVKTAINFVESLIDSEQSDEEQYL